MWHALRCRLSSLEVIKPIRNRRGEFIRIDPSRGGLSFVRIIRERAKPVRNQWDLPLSHQATKACQDVPERRLTNPVVSLDQLVQPVEIELYDALGSLAREANAD